MPTQHAPTTARSRVTLFPLEGLTVAYTTQSGDTRGLGDIAVVAVTTPDTAEGRDLWALARSMWSRASQRQEQARWILTQATRARIVRAHDHQDLPDTKWTAELDSPFQLDALFANHETLLTGRMKIG
ncbi:hypothetical protein [Streptomyces marianii]|uniref:Uncharacterized protein n=1 Tax=Streptomyces marianii TaxID=1817406 RepID=A0A5R9ECC0_9ACTN|nr:hypothetical protein [Streptomyces marianii]TLQ47636.1 hypothetical protein FEF34_36055 [Streptomyces marianii]